MVCFVIHNERGLQKLGYGMDDRGYRSLIPGRGKIYKEGQYFWKWEKVRINMCLILNGYRESARRISKSNSVRFSVRGVGRRVKFTKEGCIHEKNSSFVI